MGMQNPWKAVYREWGSWIMGRGIAMGLAIAAATATVVSAAIISQGKTISPWISGVLAATFIAWCIISFPFAAVRVASRDGLSALPPRTL
jgi:ABC-type transport system involved in cytochrome c biogenesis permease subunit